MLKLDSYTWQQHLAAKIINLWKIWAEPIDESVATVQRRHRVMQTLVLLAVTRTHRLHFTEPQIAQRKNGYTISRSKSGASSRILSKPIRVRSIVLYPSSIMYSIRALPIAGECWIPCPLHPVATKKLRWYGWLPIMRFWSK